MATHPRMMEQGGKAGGKGGGEKKKENRRNVRVVRSSTSRIVDITETKGRARTRQVVLERGRRAKRQGVVRRCVDERVDGRKKKRLEKKNIGEQRVIFVQL